MEAIGTYGRETSVLWMRLAFMDEIGTYGNKGHFLWKNKNTSHCPVHVEPCMVNMVHYSHWQIAGVFNAWLILYG